MDATEDLVPFPLFHGTSSHFLHNFKLGSAPVPWPHRDVALSLLRDTWGVLSLRKHEVSERVREDLRWDVRFEDIPSMVKNVINQVSGYSNWQHGELYVSASENRAKEYAYSGARYGGELLTRCREAIDTLSTIDLKKANELIQSAKEIMVYLRGIEGTAFLVEFDGIRVDELATELAGQDVREAVARLVKMPEGPSREILAQGINFRLADGCGIVKQLTALVGSSCEY